MDYFRIIGSYISMVKRIRCTNNCSSFFDPIF